MDQAITKENTRKTRFEKTKADKKKESSTCKDKILTVGHKTTSYIRIMLFLQFVFFLVV